MKDDTLTISYEYNRLAARSLFVGSKVVSCDYVVFSITNIIIGIIFFFCSIRAAV